MNLNREISIRLPRIPIIVIPVAFVPLLVLLGIAFFGIVPTNFRLLASLFSLIIPIIIIAFILKKKIHRGLKFLVIFLMVSILIIILGIDIMGDGVGYNLFNFIQALKIPSSLHGKGLIVYADMQHNIWTLNTENLEKSILIDGQEVGNDGSSSLINVKLSPDKSRFVYVVGYWASPLNRAYLFLGGNKIMLMKGYEDKVIIKRDIKREENCIEINQIKWSDKGNYFAILSKGGGGAIQELPGGRRIECQRRTYWLIDIFDKNGNFLENFYKGENISKAGRWTSLDGEEFIEIYPRKEFWATPIWERDKSISPDGKWIISAGSNMFSTINTFGDTVPSNDYYIRQHNNEGKGRLWLSAYDAIGEILWSPDSKQIIFSSNRGVFVLTMDRFHKPVKILPSPTFIFDWK